MGCLQLCVLIISFKIAVFEWVGGVVSMVVVVTGGLVFRLRLVEDTFLVQVRGQIYFSLLQQAVLEATSKWNEKKNRATYTETFTR